VNRTRLLLAPLLLNLLSADRAGAELTVLTPALVQKALSFAADAKQKHPTSPSDAVYRFVADFNGEFGDILPVSLRVIDTAALTVAISTPLSRVQSTLRTALATLLPLPTLDHLLDGRSLHRILVALKATGALEARRARAACSTPSVAAVRPEGGRLGDLFRHRDDDGGRGRTWP
jgi:hypothetical protein